MSNNEMPHEGHDKHLCALHEDGLLKDNFEAWKKWFIRLKRTLCCEGP